VIRAVPVSSLKTKLRKKNPKNRKFNTSPHDATHLVGRVSKHDDPRNHSVLEKTVRLVGLQGVAVRDDAVGSVDVGECFDEPLHDGSFGPT
jgi:Mg-chelatase subunit ChlI